MYKLAISALILLLLSACAPCRDGRVETLLSEPPLGQTWQRIERDISINTKFTPIPGHEFRLGRVDAWGNYTILDVFGAPHEYTVRIYTFSRKNDTGRVFEEVQHGTKSELYAKLKSLKLETLQSRSISYTKTRCTAPAPDLDTFFATIYNGGKHSFGYVEGAYRDPRYREIAILMQSQIQ